MRNTPKQNSGFTLIEVLVASTIVIVLMTIGLVSYRQAGITTRDSKRKADLEVYRQALILYRSDNGTYPTVVTPLKIPASSANIGIAGLQSYVSAPYPSDPKNVSPYGYYYSSDGVTFTLSARLEKTGTDHILGNP